MINAICLLISKYVSVEILSAGISFAVMLQRG